MQLHWCNQTSQYIPQKWKIQNLHIEILVSVFLGRSRSDILAFSILFHLSTKHSFKKGSRSSSKLALYKSAMLVIFQTYYSNILNGSSQTTFIVEKVTQLQKTGLNIHYVNYSEEADQLYDVDCWEILQKMEHLGLTFFAHNYGKQGVWSDWVG